MKFKFTEARPDPVYLLEPGDLFLSRGGTQVYQTLSGPICRLYWQEYDDPDLSSAMRERLTWGLSPDGTKVCTTPNTNESAWYEKEPGNWKRNGANFPSYWVRCLLDGGSWSKPEGLSLRWVPVRLESVESGVALMQEQRSAFLRQIVRPIISTEVEQLIAQKMSVLQVS